MKRQIGDGTIKDPMNVMSKLETKKQWEGHEMDKLYDGLRVHGRDWTKMAKIVGTRTKV